MAANSPCGDWEPYKDEKCFKIIDETTRNYDDAEKTCSQQEQEQENIATLVIIRSKDEQDFMSNFLFKTHKVLDNVWIGVKYTSNKFKWIDDSDLSFTNWASGSPQNGTGYDCVQMIPDASSMGKWINEPCGRKNLVVCQKMQNWSISRLQKSFLDARKELRDSLEDVRKQLNNQESTINKQQTTINNLKQNPVPISFIYVQLPNQPEPSSLWPTVKWQHVSSDYAGHFFRVEGGGSAAFGVTQNENAPRISEVRYNNDGTYANSLFLSGLPIGSWSERVFTGGTASEKCGLSFYTTSGEVRPLNQAVRIWKRTN